jgi:Ca2+-dependent lipid-binding protein
MSMLTVEIVFHSAHNLPIGDLNSLSSDPYIKAELLVPSRPREPDDPPVTFRTPTIRRSRQPVWTPQSAVKAQRDHEDAPPGQNDIAAVWVVNVPSDGCVDIIIVQLIRR